MSDLGKPVIEHRPRRRQRRLNLVLAVVGLIAGGSLLAIGISRWNFALANYGPAVVWRWSGVWLLLGAGLLVVGIAGGVWLLRWGRLSVVVHDGGLQLKRGDRARSLPWGEIKTVQISGVRYRSFWGSRSMLKLGTSDDQTVRLTDTLAGLSQLAATVKRNVYPRLLTEYTRYLRDGQPLPFGPLIVAAGGLTRGQRTLEWSEIAAAQLQEGQLIITPVDGHGGPLRVDARKVPNAEICLQLVQHYARGAAGG